MAFDAYFPKITLPTGKTDIRKGDGLAMIINGRVMLVDAFQGDEATSGLISWLKARKVTQIDLAVCTHAHGDHFGGFKPIVNAGFKIKEFRCYHIDSIRGGNAASREDSDNLLELIRWLQARGTHVLFVDHRDVLKFEDITWHIYRNQPAKADSDDPNAWDYVNNGSLVLYSPELEGMLPGDGPDNPKDAIAHFQKKFGKVKILTWFDVSHHGNKFSRSNAEAAKGAGAIIAYESCVEEDGPGTTDWTEFGSGRVVQQKITVWMQSADIHMHAEYGRIVFRQGDKTVSASIPYQGIAEGWGKDSKGWFYIKDGKRMTGWHKIKWSKGDDWFLFSPEGVMLTGWQKSKWSGGNDWFRLDPNTGAMQTGWIFVDGSWYYLDPKSGAMKTGWMDWKGKRCYLEPSVGRNQGHCYVNCTATIDGITYRFDKDGYATEISGGKSCLHGVDIASYQSTISPSKLSTTDFVIVKFTQGTSYLNPHADRQYSMAKAAGKLLGAYHYAEGKDAKAEAGYFVRSLGSRVGECILALDWEGNQNGKFGSGQDVSWCKAWLDEVHRLTGIRALIYMSKSVTRVYGWEPAEKQSGLWCAQYASNKATDYQASPWTDSSGFGAWDGDTIRQYSSHGHIVGYSGYIDINKAYLTRERWLDLAKPEKETKTTKATKESAEAAQTAWAPEVDQVTSPARISNSGSDEHGNYKGGKAGDQTGREWYIRDWYDRPWNCVLRHPNAEVRKCLATLAVKAANNDNIGYDQAQRETYRKALEKAGWDPAKIEEAVESDCSAGVIANIIATGHILGIAGLQNFGATYTGNMRKEGGNRGFMILTDPKYLNSSEYLLAGDIPLNDKHHVCTVVTNGTKSGAEVPLTDRAAYEIMPLLKRGSKGKVVKVLQALLGGLAIDGSFGPLTHHSVLLLQKRQGLLQDGEVGPLTWNAVIRTQPILRRGSRGAEVKAIQIMLGGLVIDGSFGPLTEAAVKRFQAAHGLEQDGEVGPLTLQALIEHTL